jgi:hypothetical protein
MAMSQMGSDCQMPHQFAGSACMRDCCRQGIPQAIANRDKVAMPRLDPGQDSAILPAAVRGTAQTPAPWPPGQLKISGRSRHVLLQVFRI